MKIKELFALFQAKRRPTFGIDITSTAVKLIAISGAEDRLCLESYGCEPLPVHALASHAIKDSHVIKNVHAVTHCIKKLLTKAQITGKQVALAVPDSAIITRLIQISDGLNDEEMEALIGLEAEKYVPYPADEINFDFEILGHSEQSADLLDVLLVVTRAEHVTRRVQVAALAGLDTQIVDVDSYATLRAAQHLVVNQLPVGNVVGIIDISSENMHLFVLDGMRLLCSRKEQLPTGLENSIENIIVQVKHALQFYYSTNQYGPVDQLLLCGELAAFPGLTALVQEQLSIATAIANPFCSMSLGKKIDCAALSEDAPEFMVAFGLALRCMELSHVPN